ncbi:MAG: hypothetical protein HS117_19395 [Verrucomicrobiaceae bacterium]|nr:hypothetical protein [Verrucomicrobiaceae bacterium]
MKPLLISLTFVAAALGGVALKQPRKPVGPCEPYAEVCRHCTDCSTCKHCAVKGGKCSVCWKK